MNFSWVAAPVVVRHISKTDSPHVAVRVVGQHLSVVVESQNTLSCCVPSSHVAAGHDLGQRVEGEVLEVSIRSPVAGI